MTKFALVAILKDGGYVWFTSVESYKETIKYYKPVDSLIRLTGEFTAINIDPSTLEPKPIE